MTEGTIYNILHQLLSYAPHSYSYVELLYKQGIDRKGEEERLSRITLHAMSIAQQASLVRITE
jgi:hypothetical protein